MQPTFFILNLGFNIFDRIWGLDLKGDRLPRESLHEDLHLTWKDLKMDQLDSLLLEFNIVLVGLYIINS